MSYLEKIRCLTEILFPFKNLCVCRGLQHTLAQARSARWLVLLVALVSVSPAWRGLYTGGVPYLGIVSGVTGALVPPCCLQGRALQALSAPAFRSAVWGVYVAGEGRKSVAPRGRSLGGVGFSWHWLCFTWAHQRGPRTSP